jgi:hypothetical protein
VQGKAGAAGMNAAGGVDHQHLGDDGQGTHGLLEQRPFPQGQESWQVGPTGGPGAGHASQ